MRYVKSFNELKDDRRDNDVVGSFNPWADSGDVMNNPDKKIKTADTITKSIFKSSKGMSKSERDWHFDMSNKFDSGKNMKNQYVRGLSTQMGEKDPEGMSNLQQILNKFMEFVPKEYINSYTNNFANKNTNSEFSKNLRTKISKLNDDLLNKFEECLNNLLKSGIPKEMVFSYVNEYIYNSEIIVKPIESPFKATEPLTTWEYTIKDQRGIPDPQKTTQLNRGRVVYYTSDQPKTQDELGKITAVPDVKATKLIKDLTDVEYLDLIDYHSSKK